MVSFKVTLSLLATIYRTGTPHINDLVEKVLYSNIIFPIMQRSSLNLAQVVKIHARV